MASDPVNDSRTGPQNQPHTLPQRSNIGAEFAIHDAGLHVPAVNSTTQSTTVLSQSQEILTTTLRSLGKWVSEQPVPQDELLSLVDSVVGGLNGVLQQVKGDMRVVRTGVRSLTAAPASSLVVAIFGLPKGVPSVQAGDQQRVLVPAVGMGGLSNKRSQVDLGRDVSKRQKSTSGKNTSQSAGQDDQASDHNSAVVRPALQSGGANLVSKTLLPADQYKWNRKVTVFYEGSIGPAGLNRFKQYLANAGHTIPLSAPNLRGSYLDRVQQIIRHIDTIITDKKNAAAAVMLRKALVLFCHPVLQSILEKAISEIVDGTERFDVLKGCPLFGEPLPNANRADVIRHIWLYCHAQVVASDSGRAFDDVIEGTPRAWDGKVSGFRIGKGLYEECGLAWILFADDSTIARCAQRDISNKSIREMIAAGEEGNPGQTERMKSVWQAIVRGEGEVTEFILECRRGLYPLAKFMLDLGAAASDLPEGLLQDLKGLAKMSAADVAYGGRVGGQ